MNISDEELNLVLDTFNKLSNLNYEPKKHEKILNVSYRNDIT